MGPYGSNTLTNFTSTPLLFKTNSFILLFVTEFTVLCFDIVLTSPVSNTGWRLNANGNMKPVQKS